MGRDLLPMRTGSTENGRGQGRAGGFIGSIHQSFGELSSIGTKSDGDELDGFEKCCSADRSRSRHLGALASLVSPKNDSIFRTWKNVMKFRNNLST